MGKRKPRPTGRPQKKNAEAEGDQEQGTIFFYMPNEKPYGIFCQWHISPITIPTASLQWLIDMAPPPPPPSSPTKPPITPSTIISTHATSSPSNPTLTFTCAEQSYMFCKSLYFSDPRTSALILSTPDPKTQKKHGQNVENFNEVQWGKVRSRVARVGNWYKFAGGGIGTGTGNAHLRNVLLRTQGRELAEASRRDRVWGIGYRGDEAEVYREFWGENLLGRCLMDVRGRIIELEGRGGEEGSVDWEWDGALDGEEEVVEEIG